MHLKLRFRDIPAEGLPLSGRFERDIFELSDDDNVQPAGPVSYDLMAEIDKDTLTLSGSLVAPMTLCCVRCLEQFPLTLKLDDYLSEFDLDEDLDGAETIDLAVPIREDILLALPNYPHCEEGDDPDRVCPRQGPFSFESRPDTTSSSAGDGSSTPEEPPSQWSALDRLSDPDR